jgi:hypothetical protein
MATVCPGPTGFGAAVTYAYLGIVHAGVCASAAGTESKGKAIVAKRSSERSTLLLLVEIFILTFLLFRVNHTKFTGYIKLVRKAKNQGKMEQILTV